MNLMKKNKHKHINIGQQSDSNYFSSSPSMWSSVVDVICDAFMFAGVDSADLDLGK